MFAFSETVELEAFTPGEADEFGNAEPGHRAPVEVRGCAFDPGTSSEPRNGLSTRVVESPRVFLPTGYVVGPQDRIRRRGVVYEVEGTPAIYVHPFNGWNPGIQVLNLRRVEG